MKPILIIIGGANGSGKTTLAREFVRLEHYTYLGADDIAYTLDERQPEKAAIEAARIFSRRFAELLEKKQSLIVESTLSGLSLRKRLEKARSLGYTVKILFIYLSSPELCIQRVAARVAKGGHDVPKADIRRRFSRANFNFQYVYKDLADEWNLFYNAGDNIYQVAVGDRRGELILDEGKYAKWNEMVKS